jgi:hypothetical protein
MQNVDKEVEELKLSCIVGGNGKWHNYFGKCLLN